MAPTFWDEHEAANLAFQESQLLNIITDYSQNIIINSLVVRLLLEEKSIFKNLLQLPTLVVVKKFFACF